MSGAVRLGDTCSGHGKFKPRANIEGSTNVFINGKASHRQGDAWGEHTEEGSSNKHDSVASEGSSTVFVNGKPKSRVGDAIACGSKMSTGSNNVFVGG